MYVYRANYPYTQKNASILYVFKILLTLHSYEQLIKYLSLAHICACITKKHIGNNEYATLIK